MVFLLCIVVLGGQAALIARISWALVCSGPPYIAIALLFRGHISAIPGQHVFCCYGGYLCRQRGFGPLRQTSYLWAGGNWDYIHIALFGLGNAFINGSANCVINDLVCGAFINALYNYRRSPGRRLLRGDGCEVQTLRAWQGRDWTLVFSV